ncbi:MAG: gamma-glutamyltransferase [Nitriliruptoraceae bacterium]|nr:gamma-glutamyltransferase [Nitriliruptoraceae bacterium]
MDTARYAPNAAIATPHHLASSAGLGVLITGGNAVDAAVAANLVLAVVTPYHCGVGGDLLAMVDDGAVHGLTSTGRAPAAATPDAIRAAIADGHGDPAVSFPGTDGMPMFGALPVTVPGAVAGWFDLLERFGTRSFGSLAQPAIALARDGFEVSPHAAAHVDRARARFERHEPWAATYGRMRAGRRFVQADLAATLAALAEDGPDAFYRGSLGARIVETLQQGGSTMTPQDLAEHAVEDVGTITHTFRDVEVLELPPPTQGVTALSALGVLDALGDAASDPGLALHRQIEAVRAAMADRGEFLGDPDLMRVRVDELLASDRLAAIAARIDDAAAGPWPPTRPAPGGTAYLCATDADGRQVSLIQSNFVGFGSGVVVPGTGIGLHDRGAHFRLDGDHASTIGPRRRPVHTLIPALARRDGEPWLVFGTMGGDAQPQIHLQVLARLLDEGCELQQALTAPRFVVDVADGSVALEDRFPAGDIAALVDRGHRVRSIGAFDHHAGHAHAIARTAAGYAVATDPRAEGAALGC